MMLDLIVLHLDTGQLLIPLLEMCFSNLVFLSSILPQCSCVLHVPSDVIYMHILFDFLHYIHTSCEVVEVVITTLARYVYTCMAFL